MKKLVIIFCVLSISFCVKSQSNCGFNIDYSQWLENYDADTTNLLAPEVFNLPCANYCFSYNPGGGGYMQMDNVSFFALAQPYHTDTSIYLDGIVIYNYYFHYCYDTTSAYKPNRCDTASLYCEILDSKRNVLYHIRYDTINQNAPCTWVKHTSACTFFALNFDTLIKVSGDFYVTMTFGKDFVYNWYAPNLMALYGTPFHCDTSVYNYPLPLTQFKGDTTWYEMNDNVQIYDSNYWTEKAAYCSIFPRINHTGVINNSSIDQAKDISEQIDIFPNPAGEGVNVNCGYKIKKIELYDETGRLLKQEQTNSYNHKLTLTDYQKGVYFIKVFTSQGQTNKKIIKK